MALTKKYCTDLITGPNWTLKDNYTELLNSESKIWASYQDYEVSIWVNLRQITKN